MQETLERVGKWEVNDRFVLPTLNDIVVDGEVQHDTVDVTTIYYDTPDRDLHAQGVVLQRRDGDGESGWQLDIPAAGGHTELHWVLSDEPPAEATALLTGVTLGKRVVDVAKVHTVRDRYRVSEPTGHRLCLAVDDDRMRASTGERLLAWREIEVETGAGAHSKRLEKRLRAAGAHPARYPTKLAHVSPKNPVTAPPPAGSAALTDYLNAQIDEIVAGDIGLRRGQDPIHDTRVAIRRLRSTLRVFGKVLDRTAVGDLDEELKWFAGLLGEVRDCHVQQVRFSEAIAEMPDTLVLGPVQMRIRNDLRAIELPARTRVSAAMESDRYLALMAVLLAWRIRPPLDQGGEQDRHPSIKALLKRARRAQRKADRRLAAALEPSAADADLLHRARKAAKRARYAAELCRPVDKRAKRKVKHYKQLQSVLGDHQDTAVATEVLRRMALGAGTTPGENGFTFGMLYAREQQIAAQSRIDARNLYRRNP